MSKCAAVSVGTSWIVLADICYRTWTGSRKSSGDTTRIILSSIVRVKSNYTPIIHFFLHSHEICNAWGYAPVQCTSLTRSSWKTDTSFSGAYLSPFFYYAHLPRTLSGVLSAMSAMVNLEIPWINIMSKMDLVSSAPSSSDTTSDEPRNGRRTRRDISRYLDPDPLLLSSARDGGRDSGRFHELNRALVQLVCRTVFAIFV